MCSRETTTSLFLASSFVFLRFCLFLVGGCKQRLFLATIPRVVKTTQSPKAKRLTSRFSHVGLFLVKVPKGYPPTN